MDQEGALHAGREQYGSEGDPLTSVNAMDRRGPGKVVKSTDAVGREGSSKG